MKPKDLKDSIEYEEIPVEFEKKDTLQYLNGSKVLHKDLSIKFIYSLGGLRPKTSRYKETITINSKEIKCVKEYYTLRPNYQQDYDLYILTADFDLYYPCKSTWSIESDDAFYNVLLFRLLDTINKSEILKMNIEALDCSSMEIIITKGKTKTEYHLELVNETDKFLREIAKLLDPYIPRAYTCVFSDYKQKQKRKKL